MQIDPCARGELRTADSWERRFKRARRQKLNHKGISFNYNPILDGLMTELHEIAAADICHDTLEGVVVKFLRNYLHKLIPMMTTGCRQSEFLSKLKKCFYGNAYKPTGISSKSEKVGNEYRQYVEIDCTASQRLWVFLRIAELAASFGQDFLSDEWQAYLALREVIDVAFIFSISENDDEENGSERGTFPEIFLESFPRRNNYFEDALLHLRSKIEKFRNLVRHNALPGERMHQKVKNFVGNNKNRMNLHVSIAKKFFSHTVTRNRLKRFQLCTAVKSVRNLPYGTARGPRLSDIPDNSKFERDLASNNTIFKCSSRTNSLGRTSNLSSTRTK